MRIADLALILREPDIHLLALATDVVVTATPRLLFVAPTRLPSQHVCLTIVPGPFGAAVVVRLATVLFLAWAPTGLPCRDLSPAIVIAVVAPVVLVRATIVVLVAAIFLLSGRPTGGPRRDVRPAVVRMALLRIEVRTTVVVLGAAPVLLIVRPRPAPSLDTGLAVIWVVMAAMDVHVIVVDHDVRLLELAGRWRRRPMVMDDDHVLAGVREGQVIRDVRANIGSDFHIVAAHSQVDVHALFNVAADDIRIDIHVVGAIDGLEHNVCSNRAVAGCVASRQQRAVVPVLNHHVRAAVRRRRALGLAHSPADPSLYWSDPLHVLTKGVGQPPIPSNTDDVLANQSVRSFACDGRG
mmetsp:Transcript_7625/g.21835  ORF Transcript_7625/g.21835 Transcript_7625/m.21835 type:complete len:353 (+) Transcript_7625:801-1859(+)